MRALEFMIICVFCSANTGAAGIRPTHTEYFFEANARISYVRSFGIRFLFSYSLNKKKYPVREADTY